MHIGRKGAGPADQCAHRIADRNALAKILDTSEIFTDVASRRFESLAAVAAVCLDEIVGQPGVPLHMLEEIGRYAALGAEPDFPRIVHMHLISQLIDQKDFLTERIVKARLTESKEAIALGIGSGREKTQAECDRQTERKSEFEGIIFHRDVLGLVKGYESFSWK